MKRSFNICIAGFLACTLFFTVTAHASLTGKIVDTAGNPVSGATVIFTDDSNPENTTNVITDSDGFYSIDISLEVENGTSNNPQAFTLGQNYPNPFNPSTVIPFTLEESGNVKIDIYNVMGQHIRTLSDEYYENGPHFVIWDGCDDNGRNLSAGIYIYRSISAGSAVSKKMLLLDGGSQSGSGVYGGTYKIENQTAAKVAERYPFSITVIHDSIIPYEENGLELNNDMDLNFMVCLEESSIAKEISFVSIPGGEFQMGDVEDMGNNDENPVHSVRISAFDMSLYEVTNAQYAEYLDEALSSGEIEIIDGDVYGSTGDWAGELYLDIGFEHNSRLECKIQYKDMSFSEINGLENLPVVGVTWYGAKAFAEYYGYDLPTEAEWEYACRGGQQNLYGTDDGTISGSNANFDDIIGFPVEVGCYLANPFGIYDMSGNVNEWCQDSYYYYFCHTNVNPVGKNDDYTRVYRGGNYLVGGFSCRSAIRYGPNITDYGRTIGFRVISRSTEWEPNGSDVVPKSLTFATIPGGTFEMGNIAGESNETPEHTVTLSTYEMSIYEVTNAQYAAYLNEALASDDIEFKNGDVYGKTGYWTGGRYLDIGYWNKIPTNLCWIEYDYGSFYVMAGKENWPVIGVTWYGAKAFAEHYGYDLPTEAEWEYACRGGQQFLYGTDDGTISSSNANYNENIGYPIEVGSYSANPYGLYDMSGNVSEWCSDWYGNYTSESATNPTGAQTGSYRVVRGGSWVNNASYCRSTFRSFYFTPVNCSGYFGFRVVSH